MWVFTARSLLTQAARINKGSGSWKSTNLGFSDYKQGVHPTHHSCTPISPEVVRTLAVKLKLREDVFWSLKLHVKLNVIKGAAVFKKHSLRRGSIQFSLPLLPLCLSLSLFSLGAAEAVTSPHSNMRNQQSEVVFRKKNKYLASSIGFVDTNF